MQTSINLTELEADEENSGEWLLSGGGLPHETILMQDGDEAIYKLRDEVGLTDKSELTLQIDTKKPEVFHAELKLSNRGLFEAIYQWNGFFIDLCNSGLESVFGTAFPKVIYVTLRAR